jgi:hypothetical protein
MQSSVATSQTTYLPPALLQAKEQLYDKLLWPLSELALEAAHTAYSGCTFKLNNVAILFRAAKLTPLKIGGFATLWKRPKVKGPIQPYGIEDSIDLFVIHIQKGTAAGQFIFPKLALYQQGILSYKDEGGKRALRVYPPWEEVPSKVAQKTQQWQSNYFLAYIEDAATLLNEFAKKYTSYHAH